MTRFGELGEEDARLDLAFGALREHVERNLAEGLVGVRQRLDHHVRRRRPPDDRDDPDRPQQPQRR
jgi:hypothetical protein